MRHSLLRPAGPAVAVAALACLLFATPASAAGPLDVCRPGEPFRWPNGGTNIPYNPDQGRLGPLSNAEAVGLVALAFQQWGDIPTASTTYMNAGPLPIDVDVTNFFPFVFPAAPDGLSAIVFDDTGEIFDLLFGPNSGVLGFAGAEWLNPTNCTILEGAAFLNGPAFGNAQEALDVLVHEFGHYQNLAHSVVNGQLVLGDTSGPTPFNTFTIPPLGGLIETMYPFYFGPAAGFSTPHKDDIASLSALYPEPSFATTTATITGHILAANGTTPLTGYNVIARNVANPFADAVSAISSDYTDDFSSGSPFVGLYTLRGLTPGAQYAIYIDGILDGGFSTPPAVPAGPEEFYNGAGESDEADPPSVFTALSVAAGATQSGINIILNTFRPGEPLPLIDDSSLSLALPFTFDICGQKFDSVIVNANGNLTFGAGDLDFSESPAEFLEGPPRIAPAWNDLQPAAGGTVFFTQSKNLFTVTFKDVPERTATGGGTGANTFSVTLRRGSDHITIEYGSLTMQDGLAGVSCGGALTSGFEDPSDLSALANGRTNLFGVPAVYEVFSPANPNDLSNRSLRFTGTTDYTDSWAEPNDTLAQARRISLPFDSIPVKRFTEIDPAGTDVDFYWFTARAGDVIVAETVTGQLDTVIGLFDRTTGTPLAIDDDSGAGTLSRVQVTIPADGEYAVAVSTWPDFDFVGDGTEGGRYVLRVFVQPAPAPTLTSAPTSTLVAGGQ